jgi:HAD superfamily hydrolase (TIGR01509 family)
VTLRTIFLDAGGVLVYPSWTRISAALAVRGVHVDPDVLARAEPHAKRQLDVAETINATSDAGRGWLYFNLLFERAGVPVDSSVESALEELRAYHNENNLWEFVPPTVFPALAALRERGLKVTIVSNSNGKLRVLFDRLKLSGCVDCLLDSDVEGIEKPDPRFFELALARSGARKETTIHVGDLYHVDVVGARNAGLRAVLLDEAGLYLEADCPRVRSITELATRIEAGEFGTVGS